MSKPTDRYELTELGRAYLEREKALERERSEHGPMHLVRHPSSRDHGTDPGLYVRRAAALEVIR